MKKLLSVTIVLMPCFLSAVNVLANDYGVAPCYNNVSDTFTDFSIDSNGKASVYVSFDGYSGVTTGATISVKLEKKILWWWSDVDNASWSDEVSGSTFSTTHTIQLSSGGTYRCTYEYQIRGTGGATDTITGEIECKY